MKLQERLSILSHLREYLTENGEQLQNIKASAYRENAWFVPEFIELAISNIEANYLAPKLLQNWVDQYRIPEQNMHPALVGLTMAGNIPLVGFHDWLTLFVAGHRQVIKPSSRDTILISHLVEKLVEWEPKIIHYIRMSERLTGCDAYIATGSNNSSRYFEYYFGKYPHIIRRNRTSAAVITGNESAVELESLADDLLQYFGLGCRNVSKLYVPRGYDFIPLLGAMKKYTWMKDHDKFRNNYDYQLSLHILNNKYYMTNDVILLIENPGLFSAISQVHYEFYETMPGEPVQSFGDDLQCLCGMGGLTFGQAQQPNLTDYADGVDTMSFALNLKM